MTNKITKADKNKNYGITAILLHWIMAVLVVGLFFLGEYMVDLDYYDGWYQLAPWWHKSIGLFVFLLLAFRLGYRLVNKPPTTLSKL